jgi:hypothetical protein
MEKKTTKRAAAKKTAKKTTKRASKKAALKLSAQGLTITLNAAQKRRAQACLRETGKITLGFQEVASTKLGDLVHAEVIVD